MSRDEWDDLRTSGRFRSVPTSMGVKWFAVMFADALVWGRSFPNDPVVYYHVVEIDVDSMVLRAAQYRRRLDGIGDAYFLELDQLAGVEFRLVNPPTAV